MALLANQILDSSIPSGTNGRAELSPFLRVTNQSITYQINSTQNDNRKNRKYPCPLCGKRFRFNSILSLHMRTHTGEKPFKCPYCDHRAAQKGNLKIHLRTHKQGFLGKGRGRIREDNRLLHELEERAILRDRQTRAGHVNNINKLQKPQLSHTVPTQLMFLSNSSAAESQPHKSTSLKVTTIPDDPTQPQPTGFRCSFCKGKFRKQQELERHIRILHKPYKCTLCEFAASQEEELIGHVETMHITADSGSGQKTVIGAGDKRKLVGEFSCMVCGQTFSQAWFLKGHMRKHKDSFEHCCQICGRRFKEPWFLKNHMKVHLNKLAGKHNLPVEHGTSVNMSNLTQDHQSNLYSQYISHIHNRFLMADRADHQDYNQILATADADMKVREILGRLISSCTGPLTDAESSSLLDFNHLHTPLSSTSLEYLQKVISKTDRLNSSHSNQGWQIMTLGLSVEQQMFSLKARQECSFYLPERDLIVDNGKASLGTPEAKDISRCGRPGSVSHHGPTEIITDMGNSHTGTVLGPQTQSSSPVTGGKIDRCPLSSDYTTAQTASLGFHLDRYHFPHWQNSRDLSSPLQPTSSSSSPNSNPKLRPGSREDWSPSEDHYLGYDSQSENALLMNKQSNLTDKDAEVEGFSPTQTRRSQYEPLDLSLRPESVTSHSAMSPAVSVQVSGVFSNGLSTSITRQLKSYSNAAAELSVKESANFQGPGEKKHDKPEPWRKAGAEYTISSLENLTPGQANHFHYQGGLLSFLRSQGHMSSTPANSHKASLNGVGDVEKDVASESESESEKALLPAWKPFQCRYCPYSASQKGNLKTHVLCVHRKPFDNSLYPDRRLRRSHTPQRPSRLRQCITGDNRRSERDLIGMTSLCGT